MLERLILGDTLNFTTTVTGYPATDGWTLKYVLVPRVSGASINFSCVADGGLHRAQVAASTTAAWTPGTYSWASWVEKGAEKYSVANGSVQLLADPRSASAPLDLRSQAEIALAAAEAALAAWTPTTRRYRINGREMEFSASADILPIISYWKAAVQREQNAAGLAAGLASRRKTYVRLNR